MTPTRVSFLFLIHTSTGEDTVHDTSAALVVLVRHTLLLTGVSDNVDNVAGVERPQEAADLNLAMLLELLGKHVPGARPVTIAVRHLDRLLDGRGEALRTPFEVSGAPVELYYIT